MTRLWEWLPFQRPWSCTGLIYPVRGTRRVAWGWCRAGGLVGISYLRLANLLRFPEEVTRLPSELIFSSPSWMIRNSKERVEERDIHQAPSAIGAAMPTY